MGEAGSLPIVKTAFTGWYKALDAVKSMPWVFFIVAALITPIGFLEIPLAAGVSWETSITAWVLAFVEAVIATPLAIAVHRYVLLDEITSRYRLDFRNTRFRRFLGFAVAVSLLPLIPDALVTYGVQREDIISLITALVGFVVIVVLIIRCLMLFPAIAVDAPGSHFASAIRDSKGHFWRIFMVLLCTGLPAIPVFFVAYAMVQSPVGSLLFVLVAGLIRAFLIAVMAAVASHIYLVYATHLGRPHNLKTPTIGEAQSLFSR